MTILRSRLLKLATACALTIMLASCSLFPSVLSWTEYVQLPDGHVIQVQRTETHQGTTYNGMSSVPAWVRETITIPREQGKPPVIWRSSWAKEPNSFEKVVATALYFENNQPRIVATSLGYADFVYGCAYTEKHRLFVWSESLGWQYDPRTRIHTHYVGEPNLLLAPRDTRALGSFTDSRGRIGPDKPSLRYRILRIDTLHEKPVCDVVPWRAKYTLQELLSEKAAN